MAYVSTVDYDTNSITVDISGLSARQNTYGGFRFRINGGSWRNVSVISSYTGYDSPNYTFSGLSPGTSYYIEGEAYTNSWYPATAKWANTDSPPRPPVPSTPSVSVSASSSTELRISWNNDSNATSWTVQIYDPYIGSRREYGTSTYWGGLSPNTMYYVQVQAHGAGGDSGWGYDYGRTLDDPLPTTNVYGYGNTSTEIYIYWDRVSRASYYQVNVNGEYRNVSGTSTYWGGLSPNTNYSVGVNVTDGSRWSGWSYTTIKTKEATPVPSNFSMTAISSSAIRFSWSPVSGASYYQVAIHTPISQSHNITGTSYDWTGLSPNTTYYGYVKAYDSSKSGFSNQSINRSATTHKARPGNWSWTTSKTSGGNFNLTASEWNSFCNRINDFRAYKNISAFSFSSASSGSSFTAAQFNQARQAINSMNANVPSTVSSGDIIYASSLNALRDALNAVT